MAKELKKYIEWLQEAQDTLIGIEPKDDWDESILSDLRHLNEIKHYLIGQLSELEYCNEK